MKKNLSIFNLAAILLLSSAMFGQVIPNPNFENWNSTPYNQPFGWSSSNQESVKKGGTITTSSVTGFAGSAVRMQTKVVGNDTLLGYIFYGPPTGDPISGQGGLPYSQKPTNITGYYRYNLPGLDTALIYVSFKKNGVVLNQDWIKVRGTGNQATFTAFTYTLTAPTLTTTPDSVIIAVASSNALGNVGIEDNSFIEVDELAFTGPGITQTITNGGFENWDALVYDDLLNWGVGGDGVSKITPGFYGAYAVQIETRMYSDNVVRASGITNGYFGQNGPPKGGQPYTLTQDTLYGWYKFTGSNDSGVVYANLTKTNTAVGGSNIYLKNQSNWTFFKMPISSGSAPDTMRLEIYSTSPGSTVTTANGSKLSIDNLYLYSSPNVSIKVNTFNSSFAMYPNPCKDLLYIKISGTETNSYQVYDALGNKVAVNNISTKTDQLKLNTEQLSKGIYFIRMENAEGTTIHKFIKE